jgi:hypothetical protein
MRLFALIPLMSRFGQQLAVFVFAHFFPSFFNDGTQKNTSLLIDMIFQFRYFLNCLIWVI